MSSERRDFERVPILGTLQGEVMVYQPMSVTDIGIHGATVESAFPLHLDSLHDVRLTLGACTVVAKARVVHSRITDVNSDVVTYQSGLEFVQLSREAGAAIVDYLAAVKAGRSAAGNAI